MVSSSGLEQEMPRSKFGTLKSRATLLTSPDTQDRSPPWHFQRTVGYYDLEVSSIYSLMVRLLLGNCRRRQLREALGLEEAEELQNPAGEILTSDWSTLSILTSDWLQLDEGYEVRDLSFDSSGTYLAVAGSDVRVYLCKQWDVLKVSYYSLEACSEIKHFHFQSLSEHTAQATGVRFGERANYVASTSMDRTLKIYAE